MKLGWGLEELHGCSSGIEEAPWPRSRESSAWEIHFSLLSRLLVRKILLEILRECCPLYTWMGLVWWLLESLSVNPWEVLLEFTFKSAEMLSDVLFQLFIDRFVIQDFTQSVEHLDISCIHLSSPWANFGNKGLNMITVADYVGPLPFSMMVRLFITINTLTELGMPYSRVFSWQTRFPLTPGLQERSPIPLVAPAPMQACFPLTTSAPGWGTAEHVQSQNLHTNVETIWLWVPHPWLSQWHWSSLLRWCWASQGVFLKQAPLGE